MVPEKVLHHIDNQVIEQLSIGQNWHDIRDYLYSNINRYKKRDAYIQVSEKYLIKNWDRVEWKKRLTTMLVIQSLRRVKDIEWIIMNQDKFKKLDCEKMYKIISLRDKLLFNKN